MSVASYAFLTLDASSPQISYFGACRGSLFSDQEHSQQSDEDGVIWARQTPASVAQRHRHTNACILLLGVYILGHQISSILGKGWVWA
jgi:hypothetical protein